MLYMCCDREFTKEDLTSLTPFEQTLLKNTIKWQKNYIKENKQLWQDILIK